MIYASSYRSWIMWRTDLLKHLKAESQIAHTAKGPIEYAWHGNKKAPIVALMHGSPGGYDQQFILDQQFDLKNYSILSWSRPGYLRTPLEVGATFEKQSEAFIALLDHLKISKVILVGISGGGGPALSCTIKFPERITSLIMQAALSKSYHPHPAQKFFMELVFHDPTQWLFNIFLQKFPRLVIKQFLKLESTFDTKILKEETERIIHNPKLFHSLITLFNSISPISARKKGLYNDLLQYKNFKLALHKIKTPTFILQGTYDNDARPDNATFMKDHIKNSTIYWLKDAGHLFWLSKDYKQAITALQKFVKNCLSFG